MSLKKVSILIFVTLTFPKSRQQYGCKLTSICFQVTEENCDRLVRGGLIQYALDVFDVKLNATNKTNPKILSAALDTLVHISNTSKFR